MSAEASRLLQALELFAARTKDADLPDGVSKAVDGLREVLGQPTADNSSPGSRAAMKAAPGTKGTGEHFTKAAKGVDSPSPGQRAAAGQRNTDLEQAAAALLAKS